MNIQWNFSSTEILISAKSFLCGNTKNGAQKISKIQILGNEFKSISKNLCYKIFKLIVLLNKYFPMLLSKLLKAFNISAYDHTVCSVFPIKQNISDYVTLLGFGRHEASLNGWQHAYDFNGLPHNNKSNINWPQCEKRPISWSCDWKFSGLKKKSFLKCFQYFVNHKPSSEYLMLWQYHWRLQD